MSAWARNTSSAVTSKDALLAAAIMPPGGPARARFRNRPGSGSPRPLTCTAARPRPQSDRKGRELGLSRNTVRGFGRADPDELLVRDGTGRRARILDAREPFPRNGGTSDCTNATALCQEIRARGPGQLRQRPHQPRALPGKDSMPALARTPEYGEYAVQGYSG